MKITKIHENKTTSTGKVQQIVSVDDNPQKLTYWGNDLVEGQDFYGEITPPSDPKYNPTLRAAKLGFTPKASKQVNFDKIMEKKEVNIQVAQGRKNDAILNASAQRDAVIIVNALITQNKLVPLADTYSPSDFEKVVKSDIKKWREWFLELNDPESKPPFEF